MKGSAKITFIVLVLLNGALAKAQSTSQPADQLQPQSTWSGNETSEAQVVNRRGGNPTAYASANIITRNGENFTFEYWHFVNGTWHGLEMRGQIRNGEVRAQATKIMPGGMWEDNILDVIWTGEYDGQTLKLSYALKNNQTVTSKLTYDPNARGRGARGGRRGRRAG